VMSVSSKSILFFCSFSFLLPPSFPLHKSKSELIKFDQKTTSSNRKSNLGKEGSKQHNLQNSQSVYKTTEQALK
jgi:hypothetical protein